MVAVPVYRTTGYDRLLSSWDMSFKDKKSSDYVAGFVIGVRGTEADLLYRYWERMSFTRTLDVMRMMKRQWPQVGGSYVEAAANGIGIVDVLKKEIPGLVLHETKGESKYSRAMAAQPFVRAGNWGLPDDSIALWDVPSFLWETGAYPNPGVNDDQVDAVSQATDEIYLGPGGPGTMHVASDRTIATGAAVAMGVRPTTGRVPPHLQRIQDQQRRRGR